MPETEVHRLRMTKADLSALGDEERRLVLLFGHMANELQTLNRLLLFSLHKEASHEVAERIAGGRANIVLRLLCGKLWEAHELLRRRVEGDAVGRKYAELMDDEGKACHRRIRQQAGGPAGKVLAQLRNNHAFHYPDDGAVDTAFEALDAAEALEFFISPNGDASFYHAAEIVFELATMRVTGISDVEQAVNRIADIVVRSTPDLVTFAGLYVGTILEQRSSLMDTLPASEIMPAEYLEDTSIPPVTVRMS